MTHQHPTDHHSSLRQQFYDALAAVGGTARLVASVDEAAATIMGIVQHLPTDHRSIWAAPAVREAMPALLDALASRNVDVRFAESPEEVRDQPFGLSVAVQAIAETGSVVLVERGLEDRSVGLMTETHIVLCHAKRLAASLDDVVPTLAGAAGHNGSYTTIITGPSRTADIERQLTVGVQGPARLHVILVENVS